MEHGASTYTGGFDAKGRRVKISALAHSLAAASRGAQGPIGLFEADNNASSIIGAQVRSQFERRRLKHVRAASIIIATRIRAYPERKRYLAQRASALLVQRFFRKRMLPQLRKQRTEERDGRHASLMRVLTTFAAAVESHDLDAIRACVDDERLSLQLILPGTNLSVSGLTAVVNRLRQLKLDKPSPFAILAEGGVLGRAALDAPTATAVRTGLLGAGKAGRLEFDLRLPATSGHAPRITQLRCTCTSHSNDRAASRFTSAPSPRSASGGAGAATSPKHDQPPPAKARRRAGDLPPIRVRGPDSDPATTEGRASAASLLPPLGAAKGRAPSAATMTKAASEPVLVLPMIGNQTRGSRDLSPRMQRAVDAHLRRRRKAERFPAFTLEPHFRSKYTM